MQLVIDIKNDSLPDKIIQLLNIFKNNEVKIKETKSQQETYLSDEYIERNCEQLIKSNQYIEDRVYCSKDL